MKISVVFVSIRYVATQIFPFLLWKQQLCFHASQSLFQECFASSRQMHVLEAHVHSEQVKIRLKTEKWIPQQVT